MGLDSCEFVFIRVDSCPAVGSVDSRPTSSAFNVQQVESHGISHGAHPPSRASHQLSPDVPAPVEGGANGRRLEQKVIITSARRELPEYVETIDTVRAESSRMLPEKVRDERADAA
jgi:hypothetical protein